MIGFLRLIGGHPPRIGEAAFFIFPQSGKEFCLAPGALGGFSHAPRLGRLRNRRLEELSAGWLGAMACASPRARRRFQYSRLALAGFVSFQPVLARSGPNEFVVAYGRVAPGEQIASITLPYFQGGPQVVGRLLVSEGEKVAAGQVLALSSNHDLAAASLAQAEARAAGMEARFALAREGAKPEDVAAQAALVASQEYEVTQAHKQLDRGAVLHGSHIVSDARLEESSARLGSLEKRLEMSRRTLDSLRHPRPNDIAAAEADLAEARAAVDLARASVALTELRAPSAGQILKIVAYPGEQPNERGVVLFGDTSAMQIKAELDVEDVSRVQIGARAEASAPAWTGAITGWVARVAPRVDHSATRPPSTLAPVDRRVVEVSVKLDHPELLRALSGAEAIVTIAVRP